MTTRRNLLTYAARSSAIVAFAIAGFSSTTQAQEPIPVVATFSILGDMVQRVGGDAITLSTLVGRNGDTHVYQPTPADAKAVKRAQLLFTNGLEFEGWLDRLAEAAAFEGATVVTTDGLELIALEEHHDDEHSDEDGHDDEHEDGHDDEHEDGHDDEHEDGHDDEHDDGHDDEHDDAHDDKHGDAHDDEHDDAHDDEHDDEHDDAHDDEHDDEHGDHEDGHHDHGEFDPHGWLSLQNAVIYVDNITEALAKAAPASAAMFYQNRATYVAEIELLDSEIKEMIAALPKSDRTVVTSHDAFQYFARDYGLKFLAPQGLSTDSEASAREVAQMIEHIRAEEISAVFVENVSDPRLLQQIARETGSTIGGKLFPGALSNEDEPASTYLDLMRHNATTITSALSEASKP